MSRNNRRLDTTRLQKMAQAYWESAALMAAVELEVFTAIAHGHDTIPAVGQGRRHQRAQRRAAADGPHRHDPADPRGRDASPTRPTCSASWSRMASAMPGRGSCSPSRAGRRSASSASGCAAARRTARPIRELHRRRRAALPRRDLLDRHGRGPPVQPQRRPRRPQADARSRRRLGRLQHRGDQDVSRPEGDRARPAAGRGGGRRIHRRQRRGRPGERDARRLHAHTTSRRASTSW